MRLTYNFLIILPLLSNFPLILIPDLTIPIYRLWVSKEFKKMDRRNAGTVEGFSFITELKGVKYGLTSN